MTTAQTHQARPIVLIVDDAPTNIRMLAEALIVEQEVRVATSGEEALALVEKIVPDLILLDIVMPGLGGYEVCRRLKESPATRDIPIIFVTGKDDEDDELLGLQLGAVDYITKPFKLPIVKARVRAQIELKRYRDLLASMSYMDGLTHIGNRRRFDESLAQIWASATRTQSPLSLILADVDHFKNYNDAYGHQAGDDCLTRVAQTLAATTRRTSDVVARYGGEEFVCILADTPLDGARAVAESFRSAVSALAVAHAHSSAADHVTLSLGVACMIPEPHTSADLIIGAADRALYRAKELGRNRVDA
jgi:diguanylate cyclase (GGDEF)-like protein